MRSKIDSNAEEFLAFSERHHLLAQQIYKLQDQLDELRADHARMGPANRQSARLISDALAQGFMKLEALVWQKREEEKELRRMVTGSNWRSLQSQP